MTNVKRKVLMNYYIINKNATLNPGFHHEVHTREHADKLNIRDRINLGWFADEIAAVAYAKSHYSDADGCKTCCPRAHRG